jgi:hypothetical protein
MGQQVAEILDYYIIMMMIMMMIIIIIIRLPETPVTSGQQGCELGWTGDRRGSV